MSKIKKVAITSIKDLKKHILKGHNLYSLKIRGAKRLSPKTIYLRGGNTFEVFHHIDSSKQALSAEQLQDTEYSHIGQAIEKGNFSTIIQ